jgi:hypothetical protein
MKDPMNSTIKNILWILLASILIAAFLMMGGCSKNIDTSPGDNIRPLTSTSAAVHEQEEEQGQGASDSENNVENPDKSDIPDSSKSDVTGKEADTNKDEDAKLPEKLTCQITITCETLVSNPEALPSGKRALIPSNGIILGSTKVSFNQGESVFDVLARATKDNGIHMEFVKTPIYNSAYIEGIHNIYEFDAGEASGWMYSVNGKFPQKGASTYVLQANDRIHWAFSFDLGRDIGGSSVNQKDE